MSKFLVVFLSVDEESVTVDADYYVVDNDDYVFEKSGIGGHPVFSCQVSKVLFVGKENSYRNIGIKRESSFGETAPSEYMVALVDGQKAIVESHRCLVEADNYTFVAEKKNIFSCNKKATLYVMSNRAV